MDREPSQDYIKGRRVSISWLKHILPENEISENSSHGEIIIYARIYNILCIALSLMPDKSANIVHSMWTLFLHDLERYSEYSWGSGVLAFLFR